MGIFINVLTGLFLLLCVLLVILILLQSDKSAGMGILGGSSQSAFGSSTADVITKATGVMIGLFMLISLGLSTLESARVNAVKKELLKTGGATKGRVMEQGTGPSGAEKGGDKNEAQKK